MSTAAPVRTARRRLRPWLFALLAVTLLLAATCAYLRLGWWRMEAACTTDGASESVTYAWGRSGFTCTYDSGPSSRRGGSEALTRPR
ncbi:hypothetical protein [Nocardioides daphniae]|uniref:Uncharacterized protein n=1 Tax=Nocardioides daphniae TaxID=402297 RepID=A0A4P7UGE2_9ACTN|nr:hypothetical protein [Nocardioides daphniae]QCC77809.1 hypothetical protein E2C04_12585 [Nocardioides daphniae]GGD28131.1 hypothetical protein GCM10007231_29560 [Nocardioides daphniae]